MISRSLAIGLGLLLGLAFGHAALGQQSGGGSVPREQAKSEVNNVQRQLVELEKHLLVLTREVELLRKEAQQKEAKPAPPPARADVKIFTLRNANASEIANVLSQLQPRDAKVRIAVFRGGNSVIVRGPANELGEIEAIIQRLDAVAADAKKAKPRPENGVREGGDDPLKVQRERVLIEEQRFADRVQAVLARARSLYADDPAAALKMLRDTHLQVWDNPDISARAADDLLSTILKARRELGQPERADAEK